MKSELLAEIQAEAKVGARLTHPHLVQLYGIVQLVDKRMALVMELGSCSLRGVLDDHTSHPEIGWDTRVRWFLGVAQGLAHLHGQQTA